MKQKFEPAKSQVFLESPSKGVKVCKRGGFYEGKWLNGKMSGEGKLCFENGELAYEGEWKNGKYDGFGIQYNEIITNDWDDFDNFQEELIKNFDLLANNWVKFQGNFEKDKRNGKGKLILSNGDIFEGNFEQDFIDGYGSYYLKDGGKFEGKWSRNQFVQF